MKITIDSQILEKDGFTLHEFSVILYYLTGGAGTVDEELCNSLWERGFLKKVIDGYAFHEGKKSKLKTWMTKSSNTPEAMDRFTELAKAMQAEFPEGKKSGTNLYWRDSTKIIAQRLAAFVKKYGDHSDEEFVQAAKDYVASNNGNYEYMQVLKYFISKKNLTTGEENSQLSSYLDNAGQKSLKDKDWTSNLI